MSTPDLATENSDAGDSLAEPRSPFSVPAFRRIWTAYIVSSFGSLVQGVGAAWMMTTLTSSSLMVTLVQASITMPTMLVSLLGGALADNLDRRKVMVVAQCFLIATSSLLAVLAYFGMLNPWLLLTSTFCIGCGAALHAPAWQASVGDIVPRNLLPGAVAYNGMGMNIARSAGPAIGGAIVAAAGAAAAFVTNVVTALGLFAVLVRWRPDYPVRHLPREAIGQAMAAGLRFVAMSPDIRVVLLRGGLFSLSAIALPALMPLVARDLIRGGPLTYGFLLGGFGLGAVCGALISRHVRANLRSNQIMALASACLAIGTAIAGASGTMVLSLPAVAVAGAGWLLAFSTANISVQMSSPRWVLARSLALYQTAIFGGMALGSSLLGVTASAFGVAEALWTAAAVALVSLLAGMIFPLPNAGKADLKPLDDWDPPEIAPSVPGDGKIVVIIVEHQVAPEHAAAFRALMTERRRIRLRDGARHWTLLRDLARSERWIERYDFPSWMDYVRHNSRRTQADVANMQALRDLRIDHAPARVERLIEQIVTVPGEARDAPR